MKMIISAIALALTLAAQTVTAQHPPARLKTDIVDTAVAAGSFKTLVAAVQAAGLVDTLKSEGPFTVFAPTDIAFDRLPEGTVGALVNDKPALTNILVYHVIAGQPRVSSLFKNKTAMTLQGQMLTFKEVNGNRYVNGSLIQQIINVKNGRIFVIDTVMLPK